MEDEITAKMLDTMKMARRLGYNEGINDALAAIIETPFEAYDAVGARQLRCLLYDVIRAKVRD